MIKKKIIKIQIKMKKIILIQAKKAKNNIEKEENKNNINIKLYKLNKKN